MFTEDKVTEMFFMADEFCRFFDSTMVKYALRDHKKRRNGHLKGFSLPNVHYAKKNNYKTFFSQFDKRIKYLTLKNHYFKI